MNWTDAIHPPLLTAELPGIGGTIKTEPEDFIVEEIPAYEPCGKGEYLYLWVEKRSMGAEYFLRQVARRLNIKDQDVGSAGMKDRHAVTRQRISVPAQVEERLPDLEGDGIRVLEVNRHTNKLKTGHLHGNRFTILIRSPESADCDSAVSAILDRIRKQGMPNFYGTQRFGRDGDTAQHGMLLLRDEPAPKGVNLRNPFFRKLALSAVQSALFNVYLSQRLQDDLLGKVLAGDVMCKWPAGGMFVAEDVDAEQKRFDAREIVTAGPIFGKKTFRAHAIAAEREAKELENAGLTTDAFARFGKLMSGTRRHNLVYLDDLTHTTETDGVRLKFSLPAGSYATVLLREIMKTDIGEQE